RGLRTLLRAPVRDLDLEAATREIVREARSRARLDGEGLRQRGHCDLADAFLSGSDSGEHEDRGLVRRHPRWGERYVLLLVRRVADHAIRTARHRVVAGRDGGV